MSATDEPAISVVIPTLNAVATLDEQLAALLDQDCPVPFEIVLADNGSTDGTIELIEHWCDRDDRIRLVSAAHAPLGGGGAKNVGVASACAPFIAFCDADDVVCPGWLRAIHHGLQVHEVVGVRRDLSTLNPQFGQPAPHTVGFHDFEGRAVISGGAFGIHRSLYLSLGGFSETQFRAVDIEFALRLLHRGHEPMLLDDAVVMVRREATGRLARRRLRVLARSLVELRRREGIGLGRQTARALRTAARLVRRLPGLHDRTRRQRWLVDAAQLAGTVSGLVASRFGHRPDPARRRWK